MGQLQNIIILIIFLVIPAVSAIAKKIQEQRELKRVEEERERRRLEFLRTGRGAPTPEPSPGHRPVTPSTPPTDARRRLEEIAARRRQQIERARRGQPATGATVRTPSTPPSTSRPPRQRTVVMTPPTGTRPPTRPTPARTPRAPQSVGVPPGGLTARQLEELRRRQAAAAQRAARPEPAAKERPKRIVEEDLSSLSGRHLQGIGPRRVGTLGAKGAGGHGAASRLAPIVPSRMTPEDWRRAVLYREILGPPMGARQDIGPG